MSRAFAPRQSYLRGGIPDASMSGLNFGPGVSAQRGQQPGAQVQTPGAIPQGLTNMSLRQPMFQPDDIANVEVPIPTGGDSSATTTVPLRLGQAAAEEDQDQTPSWKQFGAMGLGGVLGLMAGGVQGASLGTLLGALATRRRESNQGGQQNNRIPLELLQRFGLGIAGMANGGLVVGPGTGRSDSVPAVIDGNQPARLSDGEFVMTAEAVKAAGGGDQERGADKLTALMRTLEGRRGTDEAVEKDMLYRGLKTPDTASGEDQAATATGKFEPNSRRMVYNSPQGGEMTEYSVTVPYQGGWTNIPSLWGGRILSEDESLAAAEEAGWPMRVYPTLHEAEDMARRRSGSLGSKKTSRAFERRAR